MKNEETNTKGLALRMKKIIREAVHEQVPKLSLKEKRFWIKNPKKLSGQLLDSYLFFREESDFRGLSSNEIVSLAAKKDKSSQTELTQKMEGVIRKALYEVVSKLDLDELKAWLDVYKKPEDFSEVLARKLKETVQTPYSGPAPNGFDDEEMDTLLVRDPYGRAGI